MNIWYAFVFAASSEGIHRREMYLEEWVEVEYPPESTTPGEFTVTTGTLGTTQEPVVTTEGTFTTEETTTGLEEILNTVAHTTDGPTTEEPWTGPRNVTKFMEYPQSEWELLGIWSCPHE